MPPFYVRCHLASGYENVQYNCQCIFICCPLLLNTQLTNLENREDYFYLASLFKEYVETHLLSHKWVYIFCLFLSLLIIKRIVEVLTHSSLIPALHIEHVFHYTPCPVSTHDKNSKNKKALCIFHSKIKHFKIFLKPVFT